MSETGEPDQKPTPSVLKVRLGLFALSLLVSFSAWILAPDHYRNEIASDYAPQVSNLLEQGSLLSPDGELLARYPPGFPLLLAGATWISQQSGLKLAVLIALLLALLTAVSTVLVHVLAAPLLSRAAATLASVLFLTHPFILFGVLRPLSYVPFIPLLYGALILLLRALDSGRLGQFAACGALLGLSMLVRPISLLLPLALIPLLLWRLPQEMALKRRWLGAGLLVISSMVVVLPWQLTMTAYGERGLLSTGGAASLRDGLSFNHKPHRKTIVLPSKVSALSDRAWARYEDLTGPGEIGSFLWEEAREDPGTVAQLLGFKAARAWFGTDSQKPAIEGMNLLLFWLYVPLGAFGLLLAARGTREQRSFAALSALVIFYFWALTILVLSIARYLVPVLGLVVIGVAFALEWGVRRKRARASAGR